MKLTTHRSILCLLLLVAMIGGVIPAFAAGDATVVKDFKVRAVEGLLPNVTLHRLHAHEETSTSAFVLYPVAYQAVYPWPVAAATMEIASTSDSDIGAVVTVSYLDANWDAADEDVTLTGSVEVAMAHTSIRINRLKMKTPATGQTANVGVVSCANGATWTAGVPDTNILAAVKAGAGTSTGIVFSVPRNKQAVIDAFAADIASASTLEVCLKARGFAGSFVDLEHRTLLGEGFAGDAYDLVAEKSDVYATFTGAAASDVAYGSLVYHVKEEQ